MLKNGDTCPLCGQGVVTKVTITESFRYKGHYITINPYLIMRCNYCDEGIVCAETFELTEPILKAFHNRVNKKLKHGG